MMGDKVRNLEEQKFTSLGSMEQIVLQIQKTVVWWWHTYYWHRQIERDAEEAIIPNASSWWVSQYPKLKIYGLFYCVRQLYHLFCNYISFITFHSLPASHPKSLCSSFVTNLERDGIYFQEIKTQQSPSDSSVVLVTVGEDGAFVLFLKIRGSNLFCSLVIVR